MSKGLAVGIDLGTTTSLASVGMPDGQPRLLRDTQGHGIIPSVVSILPDGRILVGQRAKERLVLDPENTFFSTKRFIGRDMRREENSWAAAAYPFRIHAGENGVPTIRAHGRDYTLTDVGGMILAYLKKVAEQATGLPVPQAVITVPANFNDVQRTTTRQAGERAGFEVLRVVNEPTAAALAYGLERSGENERIAVYDFGGGTFDMTILELRGQVYEVLATAGNTLLGGDDFDKRIFDRMAKAFQAQTGLHPRENGEFHQRMFLAAERIKCQLSDWLVAGFTERGVEIAGRRVDFQFEMSREQFNEACGDLVDMSFDVCDEALRLADCTLTSIDQIILVGGTTRVPLLRERVTKYFLRPPLDKLQPDTVVSLGAAIQAFSLVGGPTMWPVPAQVAAGIRAETPTPALGVPAAVPETSLPVEEPAREGPLQAVPLQAPAPPRGTRDLRMTLEPPRGLGLPAPHPGSPAGGARMPLPPSLSVGSMPALQAEAMQSILSGRAAAPRPAPVLIDVTPMTLGIQTVGGNVEAIIRRNSQVPVEKSRLFATTSDDQTTVLIRVCQGEGKKVDENVVLGEMTLEDLPHGPRGSVSVKVTFELDTDGIFSATAVDINTGRAQRIRLTLFGG
ncbi:MAG: Hsp70 family protein [Deltaproteobacteria bacterium]|nr:Hsp70 family protein [Deltaproteobacteria bacterium]